MTDTKPWTHEEELERARIRLETAERNQCADGPDCGVCQGAVKAARREYEALLAGGE